MALDWITGWWTEDDGTEFCNLNWLEVTLGQQAILQLIAQSDLVYKDDQVIVERVIGQYWMYADGAEDDFYNNVHIRLCVRPEDPSATVWAAPINTFNMAEEKFMWHKVQALHVNDGTVEPEEPQVTNFLGVNAHPEWSHLDIKVNRKVEELDRLCLIFEWPAAAAGVTATLHIAAWIRVLVKV